MPFLLQFAVSGGKQSGGEARRRRCDLSCLRVILRLVKPAFVMRVACLSCCSLRLVEENNRVERQDVDSMIFVGVNVMSVHAGEAISDALRGVGVWNPASLAADFCGWTGGRTFLNWRPLSWAELVKKRIGMRLGNAYSAAQQDAQRSLAAVKEMAKTRGETYLELAKLYLSRRDYRNAKRRYLRVSDCVPGRFIWQFGIGWTTYSPPLVGLRQTFRSGEIVNRTPPGGISFSPPLYSASHKKDGTQCRRKSNFPPTT